MAGRLIFPDWRAFDSNGDPISGAKAYTFVSGTTTNLACYTTEALTTPHTNPVVADSAGRFPDLWAAPDIEYRIDVTNGTESSFAGATVIHSVDPVVAQGAGVNPAPRALTTTTTLTADDLNVWLYLTGTWALTIPLGSPLAPGWAFWAHNAGTGLITITASGGDLINGASTYTLDPNEVVRLEWSGAAWKAVDLSAPAGRHALWVPIEAMITRLTAGPGVSVDEQTTNKETVRTSDFDASTIEYMQFRYLMPKSWNEGTITFRPVWAHGSTTTNFKVSWGLQAVALRDGLALDAAWGTAQYSNDTGGSTATVYVGPESAAITIAGTPQAEDLVFFQVLRKADDATNDTLAIDARLIGIVMYLTTDAANDQ